MAGRISPFQLVYYTSSIIYYIVVLYSISLTLDYRTIAQHVELARLLMSYDHSADRTLNRLRQLDKRL